nr:helix-turn-helix domain-containing protein [Arsenophonus nasoniae]
MNIKTKPDIAPKTKILNHARESKNVAQTCCYFGISRETYYTGKRAYEREDEKGLSNINLALKNRQEELQKYIEGLVIYLRTTIILAHNG